MVRHTFSSGMLYGPNRRSLRSDKTTCASGTQVNTDSHSWKNSVPQARRASLPPYSNGLHLRSSKVQEKTSKSFSQNDTTEVQCNGINSSHSYSTRYGGRSADHHLESLSPSKDNNWELVKPKHNQTSSSFGVPESNHVPLSVSDVVHKLRSRRVWFSNKHSSDDEDSSDFCVKRYENIPLNSEVQNLDHGGILTNNVITKDKETSKTYEANHSQNHAVKRKRLTAEEKLIEDNKAYYKLEVKNSKLRSSGYYLHQRESIASFEDSVRSVAETEVPKETIVACNGEQTENIWISEPVCEKSNRVEVKRNKIRLSELSLLNNEAENFMFGETMRSEECSSNDESDYKNSKNSTGSNSCSVKDTVNHSRNNTGNGVEVNYLKCSMNDIKAVGKERDVTKLEHAESTDLTNKFSSQKGIYVEKNTEFPTKEKFIQKQEKYEDDSCDTTLFTTVSNDCKDNMPMRQNKLEANLSETCDVKCEVPSIQQCFGMCSQSSMKMQNKLEEGSTKTHIPCNSCKSEINCESISIPAVCNSELQMEFLPQNGSSCDDLEVKVKPSDNFSDIKNQTVTSLHFSFEDVPQSEQWYQTYQRQDEGEEFYLSNVDDCTYWKSFLLPYEMPPEQFNVMNSNMCVTKTSKVNNIKQRKRKNYSNMLDKKPRKSPRCHASTLAILSSLMHHKKRKEGEKVIDDNFSKRPEEVNNDSSVILQSNDSAQQNNIKEFDENIDNLLSLYTGIDLSSESPSIINPANDVEDVIICRKTQKFKNSKYKRPHKSEIDTNLKNKEAEVFMKECEGSDVDPVVLEELALGGDDPLGSVTRSSDRGRGGPGMDVISLINGYRDCYCVEGLTKCKDISRYDSYLQPSVKEISNRSVCVSSTADGVKSPNTRGIRVRGKRRKRKKNLTGWPVEKQKLKRRLLLKLTRPDLKVAALDELKKLDNIKNDESSFVPELTKNSCALLTDVEVCADETSKQSEVICAVNDKDNVNKVLVEVSPKNTSKCVESVDVTEDPRTLDSENVSCIDIPSVTSPRTAGKLCLSRTLSVDSNTHFCNFQPRVRVKKINSVDDINFVLKNASSASSGYNSRQLRSGSFSSSTSLKKNLCHYDSVDAMDVIQRASGRIKKSCSRWDSWSTRKRR